MSMLMGEIILDSLIVLKELDRLCSKDNVVTMPPHCLLSMQGRFFARYLSRPLDRPLKLP